MGNNTIRTGFYLAAVPSQINVILPILWTEPNIPEFLSPAVEGLNYIKTVKQYFGFTSFSQSKLLGYG